MIRADTFVKFDWPTDIRIPVAVEATIKSLSAKARFYYNSVDPEKCFLQWLGKPIMRVEIDPTIGRDFELKNWSSLVKRKIEEFIADQLVAFEKEKIEIPITEKLPYVERYDTNLHAKGVDRNV